MSWRSTMEATQAAVAAALEAATLPDPLAGAQVVLQAKQITAPGVWIKLRAVTGNLAGNYAQVTVYVITADTDVAAVWDALEALSTPVMATIPPMSTPTLVALALPQGGTPAPALRYDHDLILD